MAIANDTRPQANRVNSEVSMILQLQVRKMLLLVFGLIHCTFNRLQRCRHLHLMHPVDCCYEMHVLETDSSWLISSGRTRDNLSFVHWGFSKSFYQEGDALEVDLPAIKYQYCLLPKHGKHNCHKQMLGEAPAIWYIMTRLFNCSNCWRFSARIWTLKLYDRARKFPKKKMGLPRRKGCLKWKIGSFLPNKVDIFCTILGGPPPWGSQDLFSGAATISWSHAAKESGWCGHANPLQRHDFFLSWRDEIFLGRTYCTQFVWEEYTKTFAICLRQFWVVFPLILLCAFYFIFHDSWLVGKWCCQLQLAGSIELCFFE